MSEPYEDLDSHLLDRAVRVFYEWARSQAHPHRPFLESIAGSVVTPADLLSEAPPRSEIPAVDRNASWDAFPGQRLRWILRGGRPHAWAQVLNLVAVAAREGDAYVERVLGEISVGADADGPGMAAT